MKLFIPFIGAQFTLDAAWTFKLTEHDVYKTSEAAAKRLFEELGMQCTYAFGEREPWDFRPALQTVTLPAGTKLCIEKFELFKSSQRAKDLSEDFDRITLSMEKNGKRLAGHFTVSLVHLEGIDATVTSTKSQIYSAASQKELDKKRALLAGKGRLPEYKHWIYDASQTTQKVEHATYADPTGSFMQAWVPALQACDWYKQVILQAIIDDAADFTLPSQESAAFSSFMGMIGHSAFQNFSAFRGFPARPMSSAAADEAFEELEAAAESAEKAAVDARVAAKKAINLARAKSEFSDVFLPCFTQAWAEASSASCLFAGPEPERRWNLHNNPDAYYTGRSSGGWIGIFAKKTPLSRYGQTVDAEADGAKRYFEDSSTDFSGRITKFNHPWHALLHSTIQRIQDGFSYESCVSELKRTRSNEVFDFINIPLPGEESRAFHQEKIRTIALALAQDFVDSDLCTALHQSPHRQIGFCGYRGPHRPLFLSKPLTEEMKALVKEQLRKLAFPNRPEGSSVQMFSSLEDAAGVTFPAPEEWPAEVRMWHKQFFARMTAVFELGECNSWTHFKNSNSSNFTLGSRSIDYVGVISRTVQSLFAFMSDNGNQEEPLRVVPSADYYHSCPKIDGAFVKKMLVCNIDEERPSRDSFGDKDLAPIEANQATLDAVKNLVNKMNKVIKNGYAESLKHKAFFGVYHRGTHIQTAIYDVDSKTWSETAAFIPVGSYKDFKQQP